MNTLNIIFHQKRNVFDTQKIANFNWTNVLIVWEMLNLFYIDVLIRKITRNKKFRFMLISIGFLLDEYLFCMFCHCSLSFRVWDWLKLHHFNKSKILEWIMKFFIPDSDGNFELTMNYFSCSRNTCYVHYLVILLNQLFAIHLNGTLKKNITRNTLNLVQIMVLMFFYKFFLYLNFVPFHVRIVL